MMDQVCFGRFLSVVTINGVGITSFAYGVIGCQQQYDTQDQLATPVCSPLTLTGWQLPVSSIVSVISLLAWVVYVSANKQPSCSNGLLFVTGVIGSATLELWMVGLIATQSSIACAAFVLTTIGFCHALGMWSCSSLVLHGGCSPSVADDQSNKNNTRTGPKLKDVVCVKLVITTIFASWIVGWVGCNDQLNSDDTVCVPSTAKLIVPIILSVSGAVVWAIEIGHFKHRIMGFLCGNVQVQLTRPETEHGCWCGVSFVIGIALVSGWLLGLAILPATHLSVFTAPFMRYSLSVFHILSLMVVFQPVCHTCLFPAPEPANDEDPNPPSAAASVVEPPASAVTILTISPFTPLLPVQTLTSLV